MWRSRPVGSRSEVRSNWATIAAADVGGRADPMPIGSRPAAARRGALGSRNPPAVRSRTGFPRVGAALHVAGILGVGAILGLVGILGAGAIPGGDHTGGWNPLHAAVAGAAPSPRSTAPDSSPATQLTSSPAPALHMVRQSWTVGPGQEFSATVSLAGSGSGTRPAKSSAGTTSGTSTGASAAGLDLEVSVYARLHTRTALSQTLNGTITEPVLYRSNPISLTSLSSPAPGQYQLTLALQTADAAQSAPAAGVAGPATLPCADGAPGSCGGVYPVELQLSSNGNPMGSLITELVYVYPTSSTFHTTSPLRVALVAPLTLTTVSSRPPAGSVTQLDRVATALTSEPGVPLTVVSEASAIDTLDATTNRSDHPAAAAMIAAMTDPAHETIGQGYVPVNAGGLIDAGLGDSLAEQVSRACSTLAPWHPTPGIWVSDTTLGPDAAARLAAEACDPIRHLVVPPDAVSGNGCTITCTAPFSVADSAGRRLTAMEADAQLTSEITAPTTDPVLRAHDLLADLSLTYFEAPAAIEPRGVVLDIPYGDAVSASEVGSLISGMAVDPVLDPVTLSQLFASVPTGANAQPTSRRLLAAAGNAGLPVRALRNAHTQLAAYSTAVDATSAGQLTASTLQQLFLRSESSMLRPIEQQQAIREFTKALHAQLKRLTLPDSLVRLTSNSVLRVPITLSNDTGFPVSGTLVVSSDKLLFSPSGSCRGIDRGPGGFSGVSCTADLTKATDAVYVAVRPRIGGDFRVMVSFLAPGGQLSLVHGQITVRSLSTSIEAVVISALALLVLIGWWVRTHRKSRRRARHGLHSGHTTATMGRTRRVASRTSPAGTPTAGLPPGRRIQPQP